MNILALGGLLLAAVVVAGCTSPGSPAPPAAGDEVTIPDLSGDTAGLDDLIDGDLSDGEVPTEGAGDEDLEF